MKPAHFNARVAGAGFFLILAALLVFVSRLNRSENNTAGEPLLLYCAAVGQPALLPLAKQYEAETGQKIQIMYGGSGTLLSNTGRVDMAQGSTQLIIVDGPYGYCLTLTTNAFARITDAAFLGADRVGYLDGFFIFNSPGTDDFYISTQNDGTTFDALQYQSAMSQPDLITGIIVDHRECWVFGARSAEVWFNAGNPDFPLERNNGAILETGCVAKHSAQKLDNRVFWLSQDLNGAGMVMMASGYQPARISTHAIEERIAESSDMAGATAFCYQQNGQSFYVLNVPGIDTTLVYDVSTGSWHERAELVAGELAQWRGSCFLYAHGKNLIGGSDGNLYELDTEANTNAGDVLYRERTSPHASIPSRNRVKFSHMRLDVTVGETGQGTAPVLEMCYSDDGGFTWSNWRQRSTGAVGKYRQRVDWHMLGQAQDRVWRFRCTDDAKTAILGLYVDATECLS